MGSLIENWAARASGGRDLAALAAAAPPVFNRNGSWVEDGTALRLEQNERAFDLGLPALFRHAELTDPRILEWIDLNLADRRAHSHLLLMGNTGAGKTYSMVGAIKRLVTAAVESKQKSMPSWRYITHAEAAWKMRDFRDDSARNLFDDLLTVDILAFDELGSVPGREWGIEWLSNLIDTRYRECRTLMVATNKSLKDLSAMVGDDRVVSRLCEGRNTIRMNRDDLRIKTRGVIE